jgi:protease IV
MATISEAELIVDRRRLKRRLVLWRLAALALALAAIGAGAWSGGSLRPYKDHIARVSINGLITGDEKTLNLIREVGKSSHAKALIIRIDSPGGTTAGSEALYEEIRKVAAGKPVAAVMDTVAASGGYITAIATDHIVARGNTITGSIGVIFSFPEVSQLLDKLGIRMEEIKSGELKAEPSPYKPVSDKARAVSNQMVQDSFAWFTGLVAERRKLPMDKVLILSDGRVYTGRQALAEKLIDEVGGEEKAVSWFESDKKLASGLDVVDWKAKESLDPTGLGFSAVRSVLEALGWRPYEAAKLDGLLVLWHPQL